MPPCHHGIMPPCRQHRESVVISRLQPMEAVADTLKRTSVAEVVKRARDQSYVQRLSRQQERTTKDLGGILVPSAFQVPNEVVDEGWLRELGGAEVKVLLFIIRKTFGFNKIKTSFPRSFFGRKEVCPCGGQQPLAETGGVGGVGPCSAPCFTLENRPAPRSTAPDSPLDDGVFPRSRRCSQSPTTTAPAPRHALVAASLRFRRSRRACRGVPSPAGHSVLALARRTLSGVARDFRTPRGRGLRPRAWPVAGRWWSGLRPDAPLALRHPPNPLAQRWRGIPPGGGMAVSRWRGRV